MHQYSGIVSEFSQCRLIQQPPIWLKQDLYQRSRTFLVPSGRERIAVLKKIYLYIFIHTLTPGLLPLLKILLL